MTADDRPDADPRRETDTPTPGREPDREGGEFPTAGRILGWIGAVAAGLLVLYLGAALALRTLVPPETVARWAEPRAEATLNRDVEIGGARLTIFPHLGVALEDLTVGNLEDFQGPPLARAQSAELRVALWPLVRGDVVVDEAVGRGLDVRLQVDEEGDTNYGDLLPASEEPEPGAGPGPLPISLAVRKLEVSGSRLEYRDRRTGRLVVLDSLETDGSLSAAGEGDGWDVRVGAGSRSLTVSLPSVRGEPFRPGAAEATLGVRTGPEFRWLEVTEGSLSVGGVPLSVRGRVDSLRSPVRRLSLELAADSLELGALAGSAPAGAVPDAVEALEGVASLQVGVTGSAAEGQPPSVSGVLRLRRAGAVLAGRGRVAEGLGGTLRLAADTLRAEGLEGTVLGGPFRLSGALALDSTRAFSGRLVSTLSLAALSPGGDGSAGSGEGPSGRLAADLDLSGTAARPALSRATGTVHLEQIVLPADSPRSAVRIPEGTLRFEGRTMNWADLPMTVGQDRITTGGGVDRWGGFLADEAGLPAVRARVEAARLDLTAFLPRPDDAPTYGQLLFARLGSDSVGGRSAAEWAGALGFERPASLPAGGEVELSIDTLLFAPYTFRALEARVEFGPDLVRVPAARFELFGGRVQQSASVSLDDGGGAPFTFSLTARGLRAADFLATTSPLGRLVTGSMNLDLEATGHLDPALLPVRDSLVGRGRMSVEGGGLSENPVTGAVSDLLAYPALRSPSVERLGAPFRLVATSVRFDTARLATAAGALEWTGAVDLGGALDVGARLEVPRSRLPELSLEGAGLADEVLSRIRAGEGPLRLGLGIGGTAGSPRVSLDTDALRARAEEALRGAAEDEIQKRIQQGRSALEKRARGLLQRLTGPRDTAAPPPDTAPPDTADVSAETSADTTGGPR